MAGRGGHRNTDYETVAAGQTDQVLGPVGAAGDILESLIILGTGANSAVSIKDGSGSAIPLTAAAASGTIVIPLGIRSTSGAWKVTTGSAVTVLACGRYT
jgi:hypothetical protein